MCTICTIYNNTVRRIALSVNVVMLILQICKIEKLEKKMTFHHLSCFGKLGSRS